MTRQFRYAPRTYFLLTFAVTFVLWFGGAWASFQQGREGLYLGLMLPGLLTPFLVSLVMMAASRQPGMFREFLSRLIDLKRIRWSTWPIFFLLMPAVVVTSIGISLLFGGSPAQFSFEDGFSFSPAVVSALSVLLVAATFEELGWRGYAFDSLRARYTFLAAATVFGVLWSLWHLPLLFVNGSYQHEILTQNPWFAVNFFVSIVPMGIIISWVCEKNNKSVLAAIVFHFLINMSQEALAMTQTTKCIETGVLIAVALALVLRDKGFFLSRTDRMPEQVRYAR